MSLVDSRSSDSFIDSVFTSTNHLLTTWIPPIWLHLMDGTSNSVITQALDLHIRFPTGKTQTLSFFVTPLDQGCMIVLGYHWLTQYNPSIDWVLGHIYFFQTSQHKSKMSPSTETEPSSVPLALVPIPMQPSLPVTPHKPQVTLINAAAYSCAYKLKGSQCFQLRISLPKVMGCSTTASLVNLTSFPKSITTSWMYSASPRLENLLNTDPMISKSPWMKEQSHPSALFTPYLRKNLQLFVSSLTRTLLQGSYIHLNPLVELWSCSLGKRMARFNSVSISKASTEFPKRITICFHLSRIYSMHQERHRSTPKSIFGMHTT